MAENLLSDARVRSASLDRDGPYLPDGGGLRIRLLAPSGKHPKGARLAEYHFKTKTGGEFRHGSLHLGTIGDAFTDDAGRTRPFTLADARDRRDAARELVGKGIDPREAQRLAHAEAAEAQRNRLAELDSRRTVRGAFDRWESLYLSAHRKDGGAFVRAMFDRDVLPVIGDDPLETLRRARVADVLDRIVARGARRTANMALALLRQFARWCVARDWMAADPTLGLAKASVGGKDKSRERVLTAMEVVALRDALPASGLRPRLQHAAWLILATGCRVGEVSGARVADFDLKGKTWRIPDTKNGKPHTVHLSRFALGHARALIDLGAGSQWLLPASDPTRRAGDEDRDDGQADERDDTRSIGDKIIAKAIGDRQRETPMKGRAKASTTLVLAGGKWTPHDLRRTAATSMRDLGVSSDVIERCLNHTPQGVVAIYQRGELLVEREAAFQAWGAELERLMALDVSNVVAIPPGAARAA